MHMAASVGETRYKLLPSMTHSKLE